jgi:hypothetical protein
VDTPIYDELLSQTSASTSPESSCQWCGAPVDGEAVAQDTTDPTSGDEITLVACSEEHMASLEEHRAG